MVAPATTKAIEDEVQQDQSLDLYKYTHDLRKWTQSCRA